MGASSWIYYTPYQENLEQAFRALRQHVFETDQYGGIFPGEWVVDISGEEMDISQMQEVTEQEDGSLLPVSPRQAFQTIEEEIEEMLKRSEGGTSSILDIRRFSTTSHYYGDVPLPEDVIQHILEEVKPTKAMLETIVSQERIWSRLQGDLDLELLNKAEGHKGGGISGFSEQTLQFFAAQPPKEEIVEMLLSQEDIWIGIHRCLCLIIEQMAILTRYGTAMPFFSEDLVRFFGSERPTRAAVEAACKQREIWSHGHVGVGYYAIVYQDDVPHEIVFVGASGD